MCFLFFPKMVSILRTAQSQVLRCPCVFKCYVPVVIIELQCLSASEQIPGLFSQVLSWGTALRYSDSTNKGSEWDLEPKRVRWVKRPWRNFNAKGKDLDLIILLRDPSDALELGCDWNRTELLEFHHLAAAEVAGKEGERLDGARQGGQGLP